MTAFYMAPLQGFTDAVFRYCHARVYGPADRYFTPFIRFEKGAVRARDMRDILSPLNSGLDVTPQVIFRDNDEFDALTAALTARGFRRIDLNMGCPFRPQVRHGRGAGFPWREGALERLAARMAELPGVTFSVKLRPGVESLDEWRPFIGVINAMPLSHVTLHPRTAAAGYGGPVSAETFDAFARECRHPVVYNGDIASAADIDTVVSRRPSVAAVMAGRGLLRRPSLAAEWREGAEWPPERRLEALGHLHALLLETVSGRLEGGDHQVLAHMKPYWEYFGAGLPRKAVKAVTKATTLPRYEAAVRAITG